MASSVVRRCKYLMVVGALGAALMLPPQLAQASSTDAWAELEETVRTECLKRAAGKLTVSHIQVDPYGSDAFAYALMRGIEAGTSTERLMTCTYRKRSGRSEVSGFFDR